MHSLNGHNYTDAIFRFEMASYTVDENDNIDIIITTASTLEAEVSVLLGFIPGTAGACV